MASNVSYSDLYAPFFIIEANGELASDISRNVCRFEYSDSSKKSDELRLEVVNKGHQFTDDPRFAQGVKFKVRWGYINDVSQTREATIAKAKPNFPRGGVPTITLIAFDNRLEMNKGGRPKNWGRIASSTLAEKVAQLYKFDTDIEDSKDARKQSRIQPAGWTDVRYLGALAEQLNWEFYIADNTLHFHSIRTGAATSFSFEYFSGGNPTIIDFEPVIDMNKPTKSGVVGVDNKKGDVHSAEAGAKDKPSSPNKHTDSFAIDTGRAKGDYISSKARYPGSSALLSATAETNPAVIKKIGKAKQAKIEMKANKAKLTVVGTPRLRARQMISLQGVGNVYSGKWYAEETRHTIVPSGSIYTVQCSLNRNAQKKGKPKSATDKGKDGKGSGSNTDVEGAKVRIQTLFGTLPKNYYSGST